MRRREAGGRKEAEREGGRMREREGREEGELRCLLLLVYGIILLRSLSYRVLVQLELFYVLQNILLDSIFAIASDSNIK